MPIKEIQNQDDRNVIQKQELAEFSIRLPSLPLSLLRNIILC